MAPIGVSPVTEAGRARWANVGHTDCGADGPTIRGLSVALQFRHRGTRPWPFRHRGSTQLAVSSPGKALRSRFHRREGVPRRFVTGESRMPGKASSGCSSPRIAGGRRARTPPNSSALPGDKNGCLPRRLCCFRASDPGPGVPFRPRRNNDTLNAQVIDAELTECHTERAAWGTRSIAIDKNATPAGMAPSGAQRTARGPRNSCPGNAPVCTPSRNTT